MIPNFILASASPARLRLLHTVGIEPQVHRSNFDESLIQNDDPIALVQTLAQCKGETVANWVTQSLILGCDSLLVVEGAIYGKPSSPEDAIARWQKMRGRQGLLYTGHSLIDQTQHLQLLRCGITKVFFADLDDEEISAYVASGEPLNCAGCFALEGKGGLFVEKLEGCHSNVIGLSLPLLRLMLADLGYKITDFWKN